jgi:hypothetical protein
MSQKSSLTQPAQAVSGALTADTCDQLLDFGCRPALAKGIGEVQPAVGQHGVDFVGRRLR